MKTTIAFLPCLVIATAVVIGCKNSNAQAEDPNKLPDIVVDGGPTPIPTTYPPIVAGTLTAGGTGCLATAAAVPVISETEILIPIETVVDKDATSTLKRGACAVALPLSIPAGYKMIVNNVDVDVDIELATGGSADGSVEVFVAGSIGDALDIAAKSRTRPKRVHQTLSIDPQFETACGAGINLRSNSSVVLKDGAGNSSAKLSALKLSYRLEDCP